MDRPHRLPHTDLLFQAELTEQNVIFLHLLQAMLVVTLQLVPQTLTPKKIKKSHLHQIYQVSQKPIDMKTTLQNTVDPEIPVQQQLNEQTLESKVESLVQFLDR